VYLVVLLRRIPGPGSGLVAAQQQAANSQAATPPLVRLLQAKGMYLLQRKAAQIRSGRSVCQRCRSAACKTPYVQGSHYRKADYNQIDGCRRGNHERFGQQLGSRGHDSCRLISRSSCPELPPLPLFNRPARILLIFREAADSAWTNAGRRRQAAFRLAQEAGKRKNHRRRATNCREQRWALEEAVRSEIRWGREFEWRLSSHLWE